MLPFYTDDDDAISIESFSESAQEKRLEELGGGLAKKQSQKATKEVAKAAVRKKAATENDSGSEASSSCSSKIKDKKSKVVSSKESLKELQARLLLEAKNKITTSPLPVSPGVITNSLFISLSVHVLDDCHTSQHLLNPR